MSCNLLANLHVWCYDDNFLFVFDLYELIMLYEHVYDHNRLKIVEQYWFSAELEPISYCSMTFLWYLYLCTTKYNEKIAYREFSAFRVFAILKVRVAGWICKNDPKKYSGVVLYIYKHHFRVSSIYFVSKHIP